MTVYDNIKLFNADVSVERNSDPDASVILHWRAGISLTVGGVVIASDMVAGASCDEALSMAWEKIARAVEALS